MKLLIVYATTEGHTRKIAEYMTDLARSKGAEVDLFNSETLVQSLTNTSWNAIIVGGSVHQGQHQMSLRAFVLANLAFLNHVPSAFFSVSLSAALKDDQYQQEAQSYLTTFLQDLAWQPQMTICFAGALNYAEYDYFKLMVLRLLARQLQPGIVQPHDISYTDWQAVEGFVTTFLGLVSKQAAVLDH